MEQADVAVIGGGPSGSTVATLCARNGLDVVLYEREQGPRYRIGESLLPGTTDQLASLLGVADQIKSANFVVKPGGTFCWGNRPDMPWNLLFGGPDGSANNRVGLNVDRQRFDTILLDNAAVRGVDVRRGQAVLSVGAGNAVCGRVLETRNSDHGSRHRLRARYVVNASGQARLDLPELRARTHSRFFRKVAVWGYWDHAGRLDTPLAGNVLFEALDTSHGSAWAWFIPLSDTRSSIGVVAPRDCARGLGDNQRGALTEWLAQCPRITALLAGAQSATEPPYDRVRLCADYSYASDAFWAPGLVQAGDAACFVDVLLSSGVHLATYGALLAARSITAVLQGQLSEALAMDEYESRLRQEFAIFYAGLSGLYDMTRSRDHYIGPLRDILNHSNGVLIEWNQRGAMTGGLNREQVAPSRSDADPEAAAARNRRTMRDFNLRQLGYNGAPRIVPLTELPAIRNVLAVAPNGLGWRLPAELAADQALITELVRLMARQTRDQVRAGK